MLPWCLFLCTNSCQSFHKCAGFFIMFVWGRSNPRLDTITVSARESVAYVDCQTHVASMWGTTLIVLTRKFLAVR